MAKDALRFLGELGIVDCTDDILDKDGSSSHYVRYMLNKTTRMFEYEGLPDTIPQYMFELFLQCFGTVAFFENDGNYYAFRCEAGGPPDPYLRPTIAVISNPALAISGTYRIVNHLPSFDKDLWETYKPCVLVRNDSLDIGVIPLFKRYATQMAENDISIRSAQINSRQQTIITATTGVEIESANEYIKNLIAGKLSSIQKRPFIDGVSVMPGQSISNNLLIQLIDVQQYLKASWYNEIGLNSNFNMKSQYVSSDELGAADDMMLPLIDDMYESRVTSVNAINDFFGLNIAVRKSSAWSIKDKEATIPLIEAGIDVPMQHSGLDSIDKEDLNMELSDEAEEREELSGEAEEREELSDEAEEREELSDEAEEREELSDEAEEQEKEKGEGEG